MRRVSAESCEPMLPPDPPSPDASTPGPRTPGRAAPQPTTTLLLERLKDPADEAAWVQFDERFRGVVLSAALRLGLGHHDAEEVAQETLLQACRAYREGKYDRSRGRLSSWIAGIAQHRVIDALRRRGRGGPTQRLRAEPSGREVEDAFEAALERRVFEQAWDEVCASGAGKDAAIRAFELTMLRSVPIAEAARQCGMSVEQVYVARHRVAARIKAAAETIDAAIRDGL